MTTARKGRRPGDPEVTRQAILAAARVRFSEVGFDRATIRSIAAAAGVDPALIHHHFGSKQDLFVAAHQFPVNPADFIGALAASPPDERGERLVRFYLTMLADRDAVPLSLLRATATNEAAGAMMTEFIEAALLDHADELIDLPDAQLRLALVGSHMIGVVFARTVIGVRQLADVDLDRLVAVLAPTIQRYLTHPDAIG